jgi:hypothetical protein
LKCDMYVHVFSAMQAGLQTFSSRPVQFSFYLPQTLAAQTSKHNMVIAHMHARPTSTKSRSV